MILLVLVVFYSLIVKLACPVEVGLRSIYVFILYFLFCFFFLPAAPCDTGSCRTVCRPMSTSAGGGYHYFITFTDDLLGINMSI